MILSPYYFVPLNNEVFYPTWANKVSHDIPFGDGESGEIEIEITAVKPIFIRNHEVDDSDQILYYEVEKDGKTHRVSTEFCHYRNENGEKEFYIPGSSFRNMLQKKLKVFSFAEISIDDKKHAKRLKKRINRNTKVDYTYTIKDAVRQNIDPNSLDLAQIIFGTSKNNGALSLKGRVTVSHLRATECRESKEIKQEILGEPKETYFTNYIKQTDLTENKERVNSYKDLMADDAEISGWKFYPLQKGTGTNPPAKKNSASATQFRPLEAEAKFTGKIRYHNLRKAEIGALLSALTFHGHLDTHHHNIGMAKPLGYGEIRLKIIKIYSVHNQNKNIGLTKESINEYLENFKEMMDAWCRQHCGSSWMNTEQYRELMAIFEVKRALSIPDDRGHLYPLLQKRTGNFRNDGREIKINEFEKAKDNKEYLRLYSELFTSAPKPKSTHATSPISAPQPVNTSVITNKKMRTLLNPIWKRELRIDFRRSQFVKYHKNQTDALSPFVANAYKRLDTHTKLAKITDELYRFYTGQLSEAERVALYDRIKDIFS